MWPTRLSRHSARTARSRLPWAAGVRTVGPRHLSPKKRQPGLPAFPLFSPYSLHELIGNIPWRLRPSASRRAPLQRWGKNATGDQTLLLPGIFLSRARYNPRYRGVSIAHHYLFALAHRLDVSTEVRFQIADLHRLHGYHYTVDVTMLVISCWHPGTSKITFPSSIHPPSHSPSGTTACYSAASAPSGPRRGSRASSTESSAAAPW